MWQRLHEEGHGRIVTVAVDAQGPAAVLPWLDRAGATFTSLVDEHGEVLSALGTTVVRTFVALDPDGRALRPPVKVKADDPATYGAIRDWLATGAAEALDTLDRGGRPAASGTGGFARATSRAWLELAVTALEEGRRADATDALRRAHEADPDSAFVQKQLWALESPERFYDGAIDKEWQQRQLRQA